MDSGVNYTNLLPHALISKFFLIYTHEHRYTEDDKSLKEEANNCNSSFGSINIFPNQDQLEDYLETLTVLHEWNLAGANNAIVNHLIF